MRKRKRKELPAPKLAYDAMYPITFRFKILVLGDYGVGKTTFDANAGKFNSTSSVHGSGRFPTNYRSTMGASFNVVDMNVQDYRVKLLFWVLSDDIGFGFIHAMAIKNAVGAILLYDITNASSMTRLTYWLDLLGNEYDELLVVLAGNKVDLPDHRVISREVGLAFQREHKLTSFTEISLKTGEGVEKMFTSFRDLGLLRYLLDEW